MASASKILRRFTAFGRMDLQRNCRTQAITLKFRLRSIQFKPEACETDRKMSGDLSPAVSNN